ncbi:hypothetical protein RQP46_008555 [Phenoliferia psychrophenolica]
MLTTALGFLVLIWLAMRLSSLNSYLARVRSSPGTFLLVRPFRIYSDMLPSRKGWNIGVMEAWAQKFDLMEKFNSSVVLYTGALPTLGGQCVVADAEGAKAVFTNKRAFGKPIEDYEVLRFFGKNVVVTEGDDHKRHRRLTSPSFSERNNAMVWDDSCRVIAEWSARLDARVDSAGDSYDVDTVTTTLRMALMIISSAAFGQRHPWPQNDDDEDPAPVGRKLGFITALKGALEGTVVKLCLPNWAYSLPFEYPKHVQLCFAELEGFLKDMVRERKEAKISGGADQNDLFSALLNGVQDEEGSGVLTTEELLGNMYIFLLAGHETTAHTLAFAFTLLALYPEHQETLYEEASSVFGGRTSTYDDYSQLPYALATIQEVLRMYTPVLFIPKVALEDTMVPAHTATPGETPVPTEVFVPKGTRVAVLSSALHYNPMYWTEPFAFRPARFVDTPEERWNRDAWVPFSGGPRACLGQKFALVESVAIISHICLNYTIHVPPALVEQYRTLPGESQRDRRERIFKPTNGITLTPGPPARVLAPPPVKIAPYRDSLDQSNPASISTSAFEDMSEPYDPYLGGNASTNPTGAPAPAGAGNSKTAAIQAQIDDTVGIMRDNITKVQERGEHLDALQDKTDNLAVSAQGFRRGANRVRKQMWWKDMKMRILIAVGIAVLVIIIVVPIVVKK